ncbi:MAG: KilA-N domain-containing protein [Brevinema sp.]
MVKVGEVDIKNNSWMQIIINKEDGFVNGSLLADQIGMGLYRFLELEDIKESIEHIKVLTGNKEKYEGVSFWDNIKGMYIHPFLALEMVAIKKNEDCDYEEYYEFLKKVITEDNRYKWIEEFHG